MKLIRLAIGVGHRAFAPFDYVFTTSPEHAAGIDPICLVGLNGSGKSQFLELLADIFSAAVLTLPPYGKLLGDVSVRLPKEYLVEYLLEGRAEPIHVRLERTNKSRLTISKIESGDPVEVESDTERRNLLPDRVIGYTSGENETLSQPFYVVEEDYAGLVRDRAYREKGIKSFPEKRDMVLRGPIESPATLFINYDTNSLLVVANFLLGNPTAVEFLSSRLRLEALRSFRIVIRFDGDRPGATRPIETTPELDDIVEKLRSCASVRHIIEPGRAWVLDYYVDDAARDAFRSAFGTAQELFLALYQLFQLNALSIRKGERKFYYRRGEDLKILTRPPTVPPEELVFKIESIQWFLRGTREPLSYVDLSDGEHQYLLATGTFLALNEPDTLFLLDEIDTHFNPLWRALFISDLTDLLCAGGGRAGEFRQEVILTTHAPFIVSDCHSYNVYQFKCDAPNDEDGHVPSVTFCPVGFETYGSSFQYLLQELFDMPHLVAERALQDFRTQLEETDSPTGLRKMASAFGESAEKRELYEKLAEHAALRADHQ